MNIWYRIGHTFFRFFGQVFYSYKVINREKLIESGPCLIVCNHESFFDPPMIGVAFDNEIYYLARKTLFDNWFLKWLYKKWNSIPVDQDRPDFTSLKKIIKLLKAGNRVLVFPEGERTLDGKLGPAQPGVGLIISKSNAPVLPIRIFGAYQALPRGEKKLRLSKITIVVGDPIKFSEEELASRGKEAYQLLSTRTMEEIGKLELPGDRR